MKTIKRIMVASFTVVQLTSLKAAVVASELTELEYNEIINSSTTINSSCWNIMITTKTGWSSLQSSVTLNSLTGTVGGSYLREEMMNDVAVNFDGKENLITINIGDIWPLYLYGEIIPFNTILVNFEKILVYPNFPGGTRIKVNELSLFEEINNDGISYGQITGIDWQDSFYLNIADYNSYFSTLQSTISITGLMVIPEPSTFTLVPLISFVFFCRRR